MSEKTMELKGKLNTGARWRYSEDASIFLVRDTETRNWVAVSPADELLSPEERVELLAINEDINRWKGIRERLQEVTRPFKVKIPNWGEMEQGLTVSFIKRQNPDWSWGYNIRTNEAGQLVYSEYEKFRDNFCSPNAPQWEGKEEPVTLYLISRWEERIVSELENDEEIQALFGEP